jgi:hypothetical protein
MHRDELIYAASEEQLAEAIKEFIRITGGGGAWYERFDLYEIILRRIVDRDTTRQ